MVCPWVYPLFLNCKLSKILTRKVGYEQAKTQGGRAGKDQKDFHTGLAVSLAFTFVCV